MATVVSCTGGGGRVIGIDAQQAIPLTLSIGDDDLAELGVAVSVQAAQSIAAQFQNALNNSIFVTPFGDIPGEIRIGFIANRKCDKQNESGFNFIQYYLDRRLLPDRNRVATTVVVGSGAFRSFLTGMSLNTSAGQNVPIVEGTLIFKGWPE